MSARTAAPSSPRRVSSRKNCRKVVGCLVRMLVSGVPPARCPGLSQSMSTGGVPDLSGAKGCGQGPEGPAPVGEGVLVGRRHLGERAAVALGRDEDSVVAEAACPLGYKGDEPPDRAPGDDLPPVGPAGHGDRLEAGRALR